MSVPETENNTSSQFTSEESLPSSKDQINRKPELTESTKIEHFIGGLETNQSTIQKNSTATNHSSNKLENKMNSEIYTSNYRVPHQIEANINPRRDKTRIEDLQKCACCVMPKLKDLNLSGGLKNSCLTCKRAGCREIGEGSTCSCQFPKRISFSNCSLNKSTSNNGFVQSTTNSQPQISPQQTPSNLEHPNVVHPKKPDVENTTLQNDEIINLLLNGLNAVNLAIKLNQPGSNPNGTEKRNTINKLGLDAQKIIQDLIELQNGAKLANVSPQSDLNINFNSNQIPSCCNQGPESLDHNCCFSCNLSSRPVTSQTNMPCTLCNYCQPPPMSSAPDNLCYGNMCDNRLQCMLPKAINCAFQQCQCHPVQWTTVWPLFHSTAFL